MLFTWECTSILVGDHIKGFLCMCFQRYASDYIVLSAFQETLMSFFILVNFILFSRAISLGRWANMTVIQLETVDNQLELLKMVFSLDTAFSRALSLWKIDDFQLIFKLMLFMRVFENKATLVQIMDWYRAGNNPSIWINDGLIIWRIYESLGLDESMCTWS